MPKKNALISVANENGTLTFTVGEAGTIVLDTAKLSDELRTRAMLHGIVQKVSDAAAIAKSELTGNAKTDAKTKLDAMQSVASRLIEGEWSKRSGDGTGPVSGLLRLAYSEFAKTAAKSAKKTITDEQINAAFDKRTRSEQLALRTVPEIAVIIERIKSERGSSGATVDTVALLGELGI